MPFTQSQQHRHSPANGGGGGGTYRRPSNGSPNLPPPSGGRRRSSAAKPYADAVDRGPTPHGDPHATSTSATFGGASTVASTARRKKQRPHPVHVRVIRAPDVVYVLAPRFVHHTPAPEAAAAEAEQHLELAGNGPPMPPNGDTDSPSKSTRGGTDWLFLCPHVHPNAATPACGIPRLPADIPPPPPEEPSSPTAAAAAVAGFPGGGENSTGCKPSAADALAAQCPRGSSCPYVHATLEYATIHRSHLWNRHWTVLELIPIPRFEKGTSFEVALPNGKEIAERIESEHCLQTRALSSERRPLSHCAHFAGKGVCDLGAECLFVHYIGHAVGMKPVPLTAAVSSSGTAAASAAAAAMPSQAGANDLSQSGLFSPTLCGGLPPTMDVSLPNSRKASLAPSPANMVGGRLPPGSMMSATGHQLAFSGSAGGLDLLSPSVTSASTGAQPLLPAAVSTTAASTEVSSRTTPAGSAGTNKPGSTNPPSHVLLSGFGDVPSAPSPPGGQNHQSLPSQQPHQQTSSNQQSPSSLQGNAPPPQHHQQFQTSTTSPQQPLSPTPGQGMPQLVMLPNGQIVQVAPVTDPALMMHFQHHQHHAMLSSPNGAGGQPFMVPSQQQQQQPPGIQHGGGWPVQYAQPAMMMQPMAHPGMVPMGVMPQQHQPHFQQQHQQQRQQQHQQQQQQPQQQQQSASGQGSPGLLTPVGSHHQLSTLAASARKDDTSSTAQA